jgi:hypothetical protein
MAMKQEETEEELLEERDPHRQVEETPGHAFRRASEIEQIDDSQLPQSIKKLFKNQ